MLAITPNAVEAIKGLSSASEAEGVRISTADQPSSDAKGPELQLQLARAPEPEDSVVEAAGARLFLDERAADQLGDKVLDADVQGDEVRFAVLEQPDDDQAPAQE